jgi:hypothetical protein
LRVIFVLLDPDPDPTDQNECGADPCGSGSETLPVTLEEGCVNEMYKEMSSSHFVQQEDDHSLTYLQETADFLFTGRKRAMKISYPVG